MDSVHAAAATRQTAKSRRENQQAAAYAGHLVLKRGPVPNDLVFFGFELENRGANAGVEAGAVEHSERCAHLVAVAGTCAGRHRIRLLVEQSAYGLCGLPARRIVGHQSLNLTSALSGVYEVFHAAGQIALIGARGKGARGVLGISRVEGNLSQALDYFVGVGDTLGTLLPREIPHDTCAEDDGQEGNTCAESGFGPGKCGQDLILRVLVLLSSSMRQTTARIIVG